MTSGSVTRTATALTRCGPPDRNQPRSEIHAPAIRQFDVAIHQRTTILFSHGFLRCIWTRGAGGGATALALAWEQSFGTRARSQSMRGGRFGSRSLSRCTQYPQTIPRLHTLIRTKEPHP
jgi:hypothetical protein